MIAHNYDIESSNVKPELFETMEGFGKDLDELTDAKNGKGTH